MATIEDVWERRAQVREVAAAMFLQRERRLTRLSRTFGRLSEEERVSLAALPSEGEGPLDEP